MIIDIDRNTIIIDSPLLISELIDKLREWNIVYNEWKIISNNSYKSERKNDNGLLPLPNGTRTGDRLLPYIPDSNTITVSY